MRAALICVGTLNCEISAAHAQPVESSISQLPCAEFQQRLEAFRGGSTDAVDLAVGAYAAALEDAFAFYWSATDVARDLDRALSRCPGTVADAAERFGENVFDDFEFELRDRLAYEQ